MLPELLTKIPGPRSRSLAERLRIYESRNVTYIAENFPIFWERAKGTNVWDVDGNRFLDLTGAFAVSSLGHSNPFLVNALTEQASRLLHGMGDIHPTEHKVRLCERLSELTYERWENGKSKTVLGCSGSEAIECAMKTAYLATGKRGVISFDGCYHGTGFGSLAAGGMARFRDPFVAQLADFGETLPFGSSGLDLVKENLMSGKTGAVLVEPVLGRGGKVVPDNNFLPSLRTLCDEFESLLIFDEIYTGLNRTGKLFACEHWNVVPDIICLGKALTGGIPLSACIGRAKVMDAWPESDGEAIHTSTFLGHPGGCAMALASLDQHSNPEISKKVTSVGKRFQQLLLEIKSPKIGKIRGMGLMLGLEIINACGEPDQILARHLISRSLGAGIITLADGPGGHVLAFAPPFTITEEEMVFTANWIEKELISYLSPK